MLTMSCSVHVDAPPAAVWAALTDLDDWSGWMPGLVRIERLTEGPLAVGARFREVRRMFGREAAEVFTVTEVEVGRRLATLVDGREGATGSGIFRFAHVLEPADTGTRLCIEGVIEPTGGWFHRLMGKLMGGTMRKAVQGDLDAFARHVAGRTA